ncbi:MAG: hypothetical protein RJA22_803 [Verrucomicrobiota bacterium]|jgi:hypothetical protein
MSGSPIPKKALILILVLPVAALLGYLLAGPLDYTSIVVYSAILGLILMPVIIQHHHALVVLSLNATIDIFFLPGKPHLWMLLALVSLGVTLLSRILNKEIRLIHVPSVTWALAAVVLVALITAKLTGGLGMRALGASNFGGKRYIFIAFALVVYLAISTVRIPPEKARLYTGLYFLSALTAVLSNLIYMAGPNLWWLYYFFPVDFALGQATEDFAVGHVGMKMSRLVGFAPAAQAFLCFMLAKHGIRGLLDVTKPWRLLSLLLALVLCMMSGFRSGLLLIALFMGFQFFLEGLHRTRLAAAVAVCAVLGFAALVPLVQKLPLSVQRSLSVLPLDVDAAVRANARESTEWRLQMWEALAPQIPKYLLLGKGYSTSETDFYLASESTKRGLMRHYELSLLAGDYHNGPLSVILPFGIWGALAFLAFLAVAYRVLHNNYRHGTPALRPINTLLFGFFLAKVVFFFVVFGQIHVDLGILAALVGLSVSLNGGMAQPATQPARAAVPAPGTPAAPAPAAVPGRFRPLRA